MFAALEISIDVGLSAADLPRVGSVTERRRFGRRISEIPLKPICDAGPRGSSRSPLHFDTLNFVSGIYRRAW